MDEPVLIAAVSARALAQSAVRAGFAPYAADAFGDSDTRAAVKAFRLLPGLIGGDCEPEQLAGALLSLAEAAKRPPLGVVLGAGFEGRPETIAAAARHVRLLGNGAETVRRVKHPAFFFPVLARCGIPFPETRLDPPDAACAERGDWLAKPIGGSGGMGIAPVSQTVPGGSGAGCYFQRRHRGTNVSALFVMAREGVHLAGHSRQWTCPTPAEPFRYGGAAGPIPLPPGPARRIADIAGHLHRAFGLAGLVSLDFLADGENLLLLEVNPRPGATLDIFDDEKGALFAAHVAACLGRPVHLPPSASGEKGARAAAYLYADRGPLAVGRIKWPAWTADRPLPGTAIAGHQPVATVLAHGNTAKNAGALCRERLGRLADMLYGAR